MGLLPEEVKKKEKVRFATCNVYFPPELLAKINNAIIVSEQENLGLSRSMLIRHTVNEWLPEFEKEYAEAYDKARKQGKIK